MAYAISHPEYSFGNELTGRSANRIRYNYEKDILVERKLTSLADEKLEISSDNVMPGSISVNIIDNIGMPQLGLAIRYAKEQYRKESIDKFVELFMRAVRFLEE